MSNLTPSPVCGCHGSQLYRHAYSRRILSTSIAAILSTVSFAPTDAAEIVKAANTNALNTGVSWVGGSVPGAGDIAVWDSTVSVPNSSQLGGDVSWLGIKVTNVGGARNGTNVLTIANTNSANTMTLGSAGIDMSAALQTLVIQSKIKLAANQTWNVANANTNSNPATLSQNEDLVFIAQAANIAADLGGFTATKTGAGTAAFSSGWTISNGAFVVNEGVLHIQGGSSRVTTVNSNVNFTVNTGGTLRFAAQSGAGGLSLQNNAPITLNAGSTLALLLNQNNALNLTGNITVAGNSTWNPFGGGYTSALSTFSGNLLGSGNINYQNTATNTTGLLRFTGDNSAYTGTITVNGASGNRSLRLASFTAGSAAATWNIAAANALQIDGQTVDLGTLTGTGTVTNSSATNPATINVGAGSFAGTIIDGTASMSVAKVGTGTLELVGFNVYSGPTFVNAGTLLMAADPSALTNVTVADGATFGTKLLNAGTTLSLPSLTVGTTIGGNVRFDAGNFGNLIVPGISTPSFIPLAPTKLQLIGTNFTPGTFTLLDYSGTIGGVGFAGLSISLPPRVVGTLVNNTANTSLDVTITGQDSPKWTGAANGNWDIDTGGGTGTSNWKELISGNTTKYLQGATGGDTVLFDDTATGTTNVNLTTELRPLDITVNNTQRNYTFAGSGKLSGTAKLTKIGTGTLIIANTGANDYSGGTTIDGGIVQVGDGATAGAGSLGSGPIDINSGTLVLNRPDDFTISGAVNGLGGITKNTTAVTTVAGRVSLAGPIVLNAGALRLTSGGDLSGPISGAGSLNVAGGTVNLTGADPNTFTGNVNVSAGVLQLSKVFGTAAVPNNVSITGTGQLQSTAGDQIPDTATITLDSDGPNSVVGNDTIANAVLPPVAAGAPGTGQLIANNGLVISDTLSIAGRIFSVASGHSTTVNRITMTGGTLRIAANSAPSTLNLGTGGMAVSGGVIELGQGTGAFDAVLNMGGDLTTTGNFEINRGGFTGFEKREINLTGDRSLTIGVGTNTNVRPEIAGVGGLTKAGAGTLTLLGLNTYSGPTVVNAGTLITSTTQNGTSSITVADSANLTVRIASPGTTLTVPALTLGTSTGGQITIDLGANGNPTAAVISANTVTTKGTTTLEITGATAAGTFPLLDYTGTLGGAGFQGLTLKLPLRVAGNLVNNTANTSVDVNILGIDTPKWVGNVNANWDIDDGTGTGTANWKGVFSGTATRYIQNASGRDAVIFDDTATGSTTVNLTTALTPSSVTVDNTTKTYQFTGPGKLSGNGTLTKQGSGTLTVATENDYSGGTTINAGTVDIGGGGATGTLGSGPIVNNGVLVLNRTISTSVNNVLSGTGTITKKAADSDISLGGANTLFDGNIVVEAGRLSVSNVNGLGSSIGGTTVNTGAAVYFLTGSTTATISEAFTLSGTGAFGETTGALRVGATGLTFAGPVTLAGNSTIGVDVSGQTATITGAIGGTGGLTKTGAGTLSLGGFEPNTYTGVTTVDSGTLQLNKTDGLDALHGDVVVTGGTLTWSQPNQMADTASITINSGFMTTGNRADTVANVTINAATPVSTISGLNVTGTATITAGTHDIVNSNGTMTTNKLVLSNSIVRLGINSGPSTLNIGAGGITMTDSSITYGSAGNGAQTGLVNLGGNVTASGTNFFDINTGNPISQLDLGVVSRVFDIVFGVTTIKPSIQSATPTAGLTKTGTGTLTLLGNNTYTGDTLVQAGTLDVRGSIFGSANILVRAGATLDVTNALGGFQVSPGQTLKGGGTVIGGTAVTGALAPGEGIGTLAFSGDLTLAGTAAFELNKSGFTLGADLANVTGLLTLGGVLNITATGDALAKGDTFNLFDAGSFSGSFSAFNLPALGPGLFWDTTKLSVDGSLAVVPEPSSALMLVGGTTLLGLRRRRCR